MSCPKHITERRYLHPRTIELNEEFCAPNVIKLEYLRSKNMIESKVFCVQNKNICAPKLKLKLHRVVPKCNWKVASLVHWCWLAPWTLLTCVLVASRSPFGICFSSSSPFVLRLLFRSKDVKSHAKTSALCAPKIKIKPKAFCPEDIIWKKKKKHFVPWN